MNDRPLHHIALDIRSPHPLISALKTKLEHARVFSGVLFIRGDLLAVSVSPESAGRAITFMDTAIRALEAAGWSVSVSCSHGIPRTVLTRGEDVLRVRLWEKMIRTPAKQKGPLGEKWSYSGTGNLIFSVLDDDSYSLKPLVISDSSRRKIEDDLDEVPALLERALARRARQRAALDRMHAEREARERAAAEARERQLAQERAGRDELARREGLLDEAERWRRWETAQEYVKAVRASAGGHGGEWVAWATEALRKLDPMAARLRRLCEP